MRTAKEIRNYLKQQKWYNDFVYYTKKNLRKQPKYSKYIRNALKGYHKDLTIHNAFCWSDTKEGYYVWKFRHLKFNDWYGRKIL